MHMSMDMQHETVSHLAHIAHQDYGNDKLREAEEKELHAGFYVVDFCQRNKLYKTLKFFSLNPKTVLRWA